MKGNGKATAHKGFLDNDGNDLCVPIFMTTSSVCSLVSDFDQKATAGSFEMFLDLVSRNICTPVLVVRINLLPSCVRNETSPRCLSPLSVHHSSSQSSVSC